MMKKIRLLFFLVIYTAGLFFFFLKYVPLVKSYLIFLCPLLTIVVLTTALNFRTGTLFFVSAFPLINNLPYFFHLYEPLPMAPSALVLFLFFFLGVLIHLLVKQPSLDFHVPVAKPIYLFSSIIVISGMVTFLRYSNFFPFRSDAIYELIANAYGVTAGGSVMSLIFNSLNYLTGMAFFLILINVIASPEYLDRIIKVFCLSMFFSFIFGFVQHFGYRSLGNNPLSIRSNMINATFKDALSFGAFLSMAIPLFLGLALTSKSTMKIASSLLFSMALILIFFTGSKSGFLAALTAGFVFFVLWIQRMIRHRGKDRPLFGKLSRPKLGRCIIFLLILASLFVFKDTAMKQLTGSRTFIRMKAWIGKTNAQKFYHRSPILWKTAMAMIKDYPLTGVGIGGYIIETSNVSEQMKIPARVPESAENSPLQVASELGAIGFFVWLWIIWEIVLFIKKGFRAFRFRNENVFLFFGAVSGMAAFLVNIQAHTFIGSYEIKYMFWFLAGMAWVLGRSPDIDKEPERKGPVDAKRLIILGGILIALYGGVHLRNSLRSLSIENRMRTAGFKQDFGFYQQEKTAEGKGFQWTGRYGGRTVAVKKSVIEIPIQASHPDIQSNPVKIKIYLVKNLFRERRLLGEYVINDNLWKSFKFILPQDVNQEVIVLVKVSRTWNPQKHSGVPDPRNLGVAVGEIGFQD